MTNPFEIGRVPHEVSVGRGRLFLIAGPCVIESEAHARMMADAIQRIASDLGVPCIFKASYDKANRTSIRSFRGPGIAEGTRILRTIREVTGLPVLTDVHTAEDCTAVAESVDVLQIPAFLCRQTDLLIAAAEATAKTGGAINVKKGQFVAPWDMRHAVEKIRESGNPRISLTERGASFGYNNLVVDMRSLPIMRAFAPVVFDGTHSVQTPFRRQRSQRRPARVHPCPDPRSRSRRSRRSLPRSPRQPRRSQIRRSQRPPSQQTEAGPGTAVSNPQNRLVATRLPIPYSLLPNPYSLFPNPYSLFPVLKKNGPSKRGQSALVLSG